MTTSAEETEAVESDRPGRAWGSDVTKIAGTFLALYLAYVVLGVLGGLPGRGIFATLVQLTLLIAIYAMLTLSLNLHWGYTGLFNIGIVGFMAVGAYVTLIVTKPTAAAETASIVGGLGLPFSVGLLAGTLAAALLGLMVALPALRLRADYLAITTIALAEIVRFGFQSRTFQSVTVGDIAVGTGGGRGLIVNFDDPMARFVFDAEWFAGFVSFVDETFGIEGTLAPVLETLFIDLFLLAVVASYYWLFVRAGKSPFGRVLKAIREDEDVARALGKNTGRFKIVSFMLGCALMGLAGAFYAVYFLGSVNPTAFMPQFTFFVWVALIIGGSGSNTGSIIGAAIFVGVLFQGPLYVKNVITNFFQVGGGPRTIAGGFDGLVGFDPTPLVAYTFANINLFRIVALGVVLVWLMKRRPEGLLGHRTEVAAAIPLHPVGEPEQAGTPSATADGGTTSDGRATEDGRATGGGGEER